MTVIDDRRPAGQMHWNPRRDSPVTGDLCRLPAPPVRRPSARSAVRPTMRPGPARPATAPLHYRGYAVGVSRARHARRPVSASVTVALAGLSALITVWLGTLAHFSGDRSAAVAVPERLAVVQVQAGETLQHIAHRVAPDVPSGQVVDRIRDLNKLDSATVDAGQTLIAPLA